MGAINNNPSSWSTFFIRVGIVFVIAIITIVLGGIALKEFGVIPSVPEMPTGDKMMEEALEYFVNLEDNNSDLNRKVNNELNFRGYNFGRSASDGALDFIGPWTRKKIVEISAELNDRYDENDKITYDGIGKKTDLIKSLEIIQVFLDEGLEPEILPQDVVEIEVKSEPEPEPEQEGSGE